MAEDHPRQRFDLHILQAGALDLREAPHLLLREFDVLQILAGQLIQAVLLLLGRQRVALPVPAVEPDRKVAHCRVAARLDVRQRRLDDVAHLAIRLGPHIGGGTALQPLGHLESLLCERVAMILTADAKKLKVRFGAGGWCMTIAELVARNEGGRTVDLASRIVRYADLVPCLNAFVDTRTPGSDRKENFTIIGPGVAENPDQHVHIAEPHGFNIGGARQPPGCTNSQHSHDTAEVFVVHTGRWRFDFGEHGDDAQVFARPGDVVSFPIHAFRGFRNVGADAGFLWSVLGGNDPGRVTWAPEVCAMAQEYGLLLLEDGSLIDTAAGQAVPQDARPMPVTSREAPDPAP